MVTLKTSLLFNQNCLQHTLTKNGVIKNKTPTIDVSGYHTGKLHT